MLSDWVRSNGVPGGFAWVRTGKIFGWAPCRPSQGLEKILNH